MRQLKLTIFDGIFDNKTDKGLTVTWPEFVNLLRGLSDVFAVKATRDNPYPKNAAKLISPAYYKQGALRRNVEVIAWGSWCALDIDDISDLNTVKETFKDVEHVIYSTASSTEEKPKCRVVMPMTAEVPAERIKHFWYALNKEYQGLGDAQTKDLSRMYYVPARYENAYHFFIEHKSPNLIDPWELMRKHEYLTPAPKSSLFAKLSDDMKTELLEFQKSKLKNNHITWTSYQDCPFVSKKKLLEYQTISEGGWYHALYNMMVSIASNATRQGYNLSARELELLMRQIDMDTGNWYKNRPIHVEAERALEFIHLNQLDM